jgi:hypothetical protein
MPGYQIFYTCDVRRSTFYISFCMP